MSDQTVIAMIALALKAVRLRQEELVRILPHQSSDKQRQLVQRLEQLKKTERALEGRLEHPLSYAKDATQIYAALEDILFLIDTEHQT